MKQTIKALLMVILICCSFSLFAENDNAERIKKAAQVVMEENDIPGMAILLYVDGKPYAYYFGYANREKKLPITKDTIFELGSISKVMTSLILARQIDIAKVGLNDVITKYLKGLPEAYEDITLQDLATHTAGLPFSPPKEVRNKTDLETYLTQWSPDEAPQDNWTYSNFSIGLLGYTLEAITHDSFNNLYRKNILKPLHMQSITLDVPQELKRFYAQGYNVEGKPINPIQMNLFPAAGALKASAKDMQLFLNAAIGLPGTPDNVLYPMRMTQAAYLGLDNKDQGLGWQIYKLNSKNIENLLDEPYTTSISSYPVKQIYDKPIYNGSDLIDKSGTTNGFRAYMAVIPNKKSGIVVLVNRNVPNNSIVKMARQILFQSCKVMVEPDEA